MRYELTDNEWTAIRPMLPNKPRGVPRVNDRRVVNGIFWVLRSGAPRRAQAWITVPTSLAPSAIANMARANSSVSTVRLWRPRDSVLCRLRICPGPSTKAPSRTRRMSR